MNVPVVIPRGERGLVRVFHVDRPAAELNALGRSEIGERLLGLDGIDVEQVELFPLSNLDGLGLSAYLSEGHGIPESELAGDIADLDALDGHVLLMRSAAVPGSGTTLSLASGVAHIATYAEEPTDWTATAFEADSALRSPGSAASPRDARAEARRIGGRIFAAFMVVIALIIVLVLI